MISEDELVRVLAGDFLSRGHYVVSADVFTVGDEGHPWSIWLAVVANSRESVMAKVTQRFTSTSKYVCINSIHFSLGPVNLLHLVSETEDIFWYVKFVNV